MAVKKKPKSKAKSKRKKAKPKAGRSAAGASKRKSATSGRKRSSGRAASGSTGKSTRRGRAASGSTGKSTRRGELTAAERTKRAGQLKARLLERRSVLLSGMEHSARYRPEPGTVKGDSSDLAADSLDSDTTVQLAESGSQEIAQIDKAIESIYNGTYGKCESCSDYIPWLRLEALPYATQCIKCKELDERKGSVGSATAGWSAVDEFEALGQD